MAQPTLMERAFELARVGPCATVDDIRAKLKREGFELVEAHLYGPEIGKTLRTLISARNAATKAGDP